MRYIILTDNNAGQSLHGLYPILSVSCELLCVLRATVH